MKKRQRYVFRHSYHNSGLGGRGENFLTAFLEPRQSRTTEPVEVSKSFSGRLLGFSIEDTFTKSCEAFID